MKIANFSKRLYKDEMGKMLVDEISYFKEVFNQAKRFVFQTLVREKRWKRKLHEESIHLVVKKKFGVNDYVANSVVQRSKCSFLLSNGAKQIVYQANRGKDEKNQEKAQKRTNLFDSGKENKRKLYQRKPTFS